MRSITFTTNCHFIPSTFFCSCNRLVRKYSLKHGCCNCYRVQVYIYIYIYICGSIVSDGDVKEWNGVFLLLFVVVLFGFCWVWDFFFFFSFLFFVVCLFVCFFFGGGLGFFCCFGLLGCFVCWGFFFFLSFFLFCSGDY